MANGDKLAHRTRDITECSLCSDTFKEPKVLSCFHSYCLVCLEEYGKYKKSGDEVTCPLCGKAFTVPNEGFKDIKTNTFMKMLLQIKQASSKTTEKIIRCEICTGIPDMPTAAAYCFECRQNLCEPCSVRHKYQTCSVRHQVVNISEKPSIEELLKMEPIYCGMHPDKEIEFYCFDCKETICIICYVDHKLEKHNCCDIKNAAHEFGPQLKRDGDRVSLCMSLYQEQIKLVEDNKMGLENRAKVTRAEISKKYEELKALLDTHYRRLMTEVDTLCEKRMREFHERQDAVQREVAIMESFTRYCDEMIHKGSPRDIVSNATNLNVRADELLITGKMFMRECASITLPSFDINFAPSAIITKYTENWIGKLAGDVPCNAENVQAAEAIQKSEELNEEIKKLKSCKVEESSTIISKEKIRQDICKEETSYSLRFLTATSIRASILLSKKRNCAIAISPGKIFLASYQSSEIDVFDSTLFTSLPSIEISKSSSVRAMTCCPVNKCLYVINDQSSIFRLDISINRPTSSPSQPTWKGGNNCNGISVTPNYNVLVTLSAPVGVKEYTTRGQCVRQITFDASISGLQFCIKLSSGNFVVSHTGSTQQRVCLVNPQGLVIHSYGGFPGSGANQLCNPRQLSVDKEGHVFVADRDNNRVRLLSPTLTYLGDVQIPGNDQLAGPAALCFDQDKQHLYIGEYLSGRVLVLSCDTA